MSGIAKKSSGAKRRLFGDDKEDGKKVDDYSSAAPGPTDDLSQRTKHVATIIETPQKRSKQDFFSPKRKPVVTPDKAEDVDDDGVEVLSPPPKKTRLSDRFLPTKVETAKSEKPYVPTYIHQNLSYKRKGKASLPENVIETYKLVESNYKIPEDFETNRSYGPLSGISFEERAIAAYNLSKLEGKSGSEVDICSNCVSIGHKRNDCPKLI